MPRPGQGRQRRGAYYVFDDLRNLAQIRRVFRRRDDIRQRHCTADIGESHDAAQRHRPPAKSNLDPLDEQRSASYRRFFRIESGA